MARVSKRKAVAEKRRDPTEAERLAIDAAKARDKERPARPEIDAGMNDGALRLGPAHADADGGAYQVRDAFGSSSHQFITQSLMGLINTVGTDGDKVGAAVSLVAAIAPQDELESALAQQMAVTHELTMTMAGRARKADRLDTMQAYSNLQTKFARTFAAQIDALNKLRTGGKQVVEHRYIYVGEGGQAIVADQFNYNGGHGSPFIPGRGHAPSAALSGAHPVGQPLSGASGDGQEPVPNARRGER